MKRGRLLGAAVGRGRRKETRFRWAMLVLAAVAPLTVGLPEANEASAASQPNATIPLIRMGTVGTCSTLDPDRLYECSLYEQQSLETLLTIGPNGSLQPDLATSWDQTNQVTYVYHLRQGVTFWDGDEMTSADVVNALDYQRKPGSEVYFAFEDVGSVKATNAYTVVVTLKHPEASWRYVLANFGTIFEKKFQQEHPTTMGNPGVLIEGTGPWMIDSLSPIRGAELLANPHWWGGRVPVQNISVSFFTSVTSEALAIRAGELDFTYIFSDPVRFAADSGGKVLAWPSPNDMGIFAMNVNVKPWNDVHVRQAVAYALDRTDLIAANGGPTTAQPDYTLIPEQELRLLGSQSQVDALLKSVPQYPFDLAKARQEMAESAYPNGFTTTTYTTTGIDTWVDICEVIAAELEKIGIKMNVKVLPGSAWSAMVYGPKTFGNLFTYFGAGSPDPGAQPNALLGSENLKPGGTDYADYDPGSVDDLLAQGEAASDPAARLAIYGELLRKLAVDVPYVPLFNLDEFIALGDKFTIPPSESSDNWDWVVNQWPFHIQAVG